MEHKLVTGGEQYLPFARSRIKALRATGLEYASQQFEMGDASVKVRIAGEHEYITLSGEAGLIWVLIRVQRTSIPAGGGWNDRFGLQPPLTQTRKVKSKLIRLANFSAKGRHKIISGEGTATLNVTQRSLASLYYYQVYALTPLGIENGAVLPADGSRPVLLRPDYYTATPLIGSSNEYYDSARTVTGLNTLLSTVSGFAPYAGKATTYSQADDADFSVGTDSRTREYYGPPFAFDSDRTYNITYSRTRLTKINGKGATAEHTRAFNKSGVLHERGSSINNTVVSISTSSTDIGDYAHEPVFFSGNPEYSTVDNPEAGTIALQKSYQYAATPPTNQFIETTPTRSFVGFHDPKANSTDWHIGNGPVVVNTTSADPEWDPALGPVPRARRRREVSWHKQGYDFIQYGGDEAYVYDRKNSPASIKYFSGGRRALAITYNKFVRWKSFFDIDVLELCDQPGDLNTMVVAKTLNLREIPALANDPVMMEGLSKPYALFGSGDQFNPETNSVQANYVTADGENARITIQIMFDQKALFDPSAVWE